MTRKWLENRRKDSKLTEAEICKRVGISITYYRYIEIGQRRPSPQVAQKIAEILDFDWTLFFKP
jgi:transcriptional regulator with XRE-family HTH domain